MSNYRPSFAQKQLNKHGWKEGSGLGKNENGIKSAIKVKVKNNKVGLGHDSGAEFTFHWWDHIFNKAANAIEVVDDDENEGIVLKKNENAKKIVPQLMYNKKPLSKSTNGKPLLYGTFVSGGTVSTNDCDSNGNTPHSTSESDSESEEEEEYSTDLLDRTYKKTGLTGHKGARHGFKLSGKLKRIQEQESNASSLKVEKVKSDNNRKKRKSDNDNKEEEKTVIKKHKLNDSDDKPQKKKKKSKSNSHDEYDESLQNKQKKKKKRKKNKDE